MAEPRTVPSFSPERADKSDTKSLKVCPEFSIFNDIFCAHTAISAGLGTSPWMPTDHRQLQKRRPTRLRTVLFCSFSPAISKKAVKKISDEIRKWYLHRRTAESIEDLAKMLNPKLRGWFNYYGRFNPSALRPTERLVGQSLVRWACRKYKKLRRHRTRAWEWLLRLLDRQPTLLVLWERQRSEVFTMGAV